MFLQNYFRNNIFKKQCDLLHLGVGDGVAECCWDSYYKVPKDGNLDSCEMPLARNLFLFLTAIAGEEIQKYFLTPKELVKGSIIFTQKDLKTNVLFSSS